MLPLFIEHGTRRLAQIARRDANPFIVLKKPDDAVLEGITSEPTLIAGADCFDDWRQEAGQIEERERPLFAKRLDVVIGHPIAVTATDVACAVLIFMPSTAHGLEREIMIDDAELRLPILVIRLDPKGGDKGLR